MRIGILTSALLVCSAFNVIAGGDNLDEIFPPGTPRTKLSFGSAICGAIDFASPDVQTVEQEKKYVRKIFTMCLPELNSVPMIDMAKKIADITEHEVLAKEPSREVLIGLIKLYSLFESSYYAEIRFQQCAHDLSGFVTVPDGIGTAPNKCFSKVREAVRAFCNGFRENEGPVNKFLFGGQVGQFIYCDGSERRAWFDQTTAFFSVAGMDDGACKTILACSEMMRRAFPNVGASYEHLPPEPGVPLEVRDVGTLKCLLGVFIMWLGK
ncbi:hypothetical protein HOD08_03930 [bacterium]|nr:hypothetical protein [bacterium]